MATDSFANHFAQICGDCTTSNHVRAKIKQDVSVEVIWQGDSIKCTKSARTRDCRICMVERKQIMQALRDDKHKVINENDDIYAACKCSSRFHKFTDIHSFALRTRLTQKKVTPNRKKRNSRGTGKKSSSESESPICSPITPVLIDTNVPGFPYREPCTNPSNLHLAQRRMWDMRQTLESETGIVDI